MPLLILICKHEHHPSSDHILSCGLCQAPKPEEDPSALNFWPKSGDSPRPVFGLGAGAAALRARLWDDCPGDQVPLMRPAVVLI